MVLAIAALLFQFGSAVPAVPVAAASAAKSATSAKPVAPAPVVNLPDAPIPSVVLSAPVPSNSSGARSVSQGPQSSPAVLRLASLDSAGNNTQTLSTIHIPEENSKPFQRINVEQTASRRSWLILSVAQSSAATFDAYATRHAIENGAHEVDPFMRPFAGTSGIYAAIQVCPLVLDYTARRMQRSENPVIRHTWWLPQAVGTGVYLFSGTHDMRVASQH